MPERNPHKPSFAPSSFSRWGACPGSVSLIAEKGAVSESQAASWGTTAHEIAEKKLKGTALSPEDGEFLRDHRDLEEAVDKYVAFIRDRGRWGGCGLEIEKRVKMTFSGSEGRIDAFLVWKHGGEWQIIDLKTGAFPVKPENDQLKIYAAELLHQTPEAARPEMVTLTIFQPKVSETPLSWRTEAVSLLSWRERVLLPAYRAASAEKAPRKAGERQCRFCPVRSSCDEHQAWKRRGSELVLKSGDAALQGLLFSRIKKSWEEDHATLGAAGGTA